MENEMTDTPKTKSLGTIDPVKAKKITGFADYQKASAAMIEARTLTQAAKAKVKDAIKKSLKVDGNVDFSVETNGAVRVYLDLVEKKRRATQAGPDLSDKF
jgi:hypothetical protein